ncbi:MAG TPA: hypothetical protein VGR35_15755 [Tepidisphaeraceae bacterium]|nr:hypothetical protein [Tepidisphaeraceae bacterium]
MRSLLPSGTELAIFGTIAVLCTGIVGAGSIPTDLMLPLLAMPVFVIAAVMGLRRSPQWAEPAGDEAGDDAAV